MTLGIKKAGALVLVGILGGFCARPYIEQAHHYVTNFLSSNKATIEHAIDNSPIGDEFGPSGDVLDKITTTLEDQYLKPETGNITGGPAEEKYLWVHQKDSKDPVPYFRTIDGVVLGEDVVYRHQPGVKPTSVEQKDLQ
jgi:hypothetical protein